VGSKRHLDMSSIVSEVKASPPSQKPKRLPPGIHGEILVGLDGTRFSLKQRDVLPDSIKRVLTEGVQVVFDECGCGGNCGFVYAPMEDLEKLRRKIPSLETNKGQTGSMSLWQAENGSQLLLVQGPVSWI
jgi:hypothetical protein